MVSCVCVHVCVCGPDHLPDTRTPFLQRRKDQLWHTAITHIDTWQSYKYIIHAKSHQKSLTPSPVTCLSNYRLLPHYLFLFSALFQSLLFPVDSIPTHPSFPFKLVPPSTQTTTPSFCLPFMMSALLLLPHFVTFSLSFVLLHWQ